MEYRYSVQILFPFINVSKTKPDGEIIAHDANGYKFVELRAMSGFKAYKKREKNTCFEFLLDDKQVVKVSKKFCLIKEIKD